MGVPVNLLVRQVRVHDPDALLASNLAQSFPKGLTLASSSGSPSSSNRVTNYVNPSTVAPWLYTFTLQRSNHVDIHAIVMEREPV